MGMNGMIAISRKLFDPEDPFFGGEPFTRREAWQWLIVMAAWKPKRVRISTGRGDTYVELQRGQLSYSRAYMREAWGWSSEKRVRTFLDRLEMDSRIGRASGQQEGQAQVVITICKYDEYQYGGQSEGQPSGQQEGQALGQARANQGPEYEEGIRKKKKDTTRERAGEPLSGFEQWYSAYGKKVSRKAAERAYAKVFAAGEISAAELLVRTERFAAYWKQQPPDRQQFKPQPASWLNAGGYLDECDPAGKSWKPSEPTARPDPSTFSNERWRQCLSLHNRTREWGDWGPPPGTAGCMVPSELLVTERSAMQ